ncbi:hypothetical protein GTU73_10575 [Rathayibacter sp. VKM Ac-2804]|uniref:hypothetical protein n=1 Tax=unclassified Rathayibacter TaxID=2609250 RepID=UPI00132E74CA|nr:MULTISPECIES: hypothetical protein [unclassified Rathayibacter]NRG39323.1 hypothetical protein [Rathayibacter sp. VKM Ac-2835]QHF24406.1 hypothetical protein GTU73_10575 [Rathayibacter sp. VKM Ac-2804]
MSDSRPDVPGVTRRAAMAMAWSAPVIATAVGAPAAAASAPRPLEVGPYVGLFLDSLSSGNFVLELRAAHSGPPGAPVELLSDARMDVTAEHDVGHWSEWLVVDRPRCAHLVIPAGSSPSRGMYTDREGRLMQVAPLGPGRMFCALTPLPPGRFRVTATVTRGPVSPETTGEAPAFLGLPTRTVLVDV